MRPLSTLEAALLRALGTVTAPGGPRSSLLVLIYHRVLETPDPLLADEPDAVEFAAQMDLIRRVGNVLPLQEAVDRLARRALPPRAISITFDDGYTNNRTVAAPILQARGIPATVFVATGFIGNGRMWNDTVIESVRRAGERLDLRELGLPEFQLTDTAARRAAIDRILDALKRGDPAERLARVEQIAARVDLPQPHGVMMSESQIRELYDLGIDVGAHTVMHPILKSVSTARAQQEIAESKATLEAVTGRPVTLFAYPNGRPNRDYDATHVQLVRAAGFKAAVSTAWGATCGRSDLYQIPRMLPWQRSPLKFGARLLWTYRERDAEVAA